jgi:adenylate cyclase
VEVPEVAARLKVSHVLEGSVRKAGSRVRITAQLIDGATGNHLWAERYDRDLDDIFALQDEISEAIVAALKLKLLPQEKQAIERRGTDSAEAYDLYLMARSYWMSTNGGDPRPMEAAERLCGRAVEIDPGYALAWAMMSSAQNHLSTLFGRANDGGEAALDRALTLNPDLAEARASRAVILSYAGQNEEAAAEIAVALRLDPESFEVNYRAGSIAYRQTRLADAVPYFEKAAALAEDDLASAHILLSCYVALSDRDNTRRTAGSTLARAERAIAQDRNDGSAMETGAYALAVLGETDRARDWMARGLLIDPDNLQMRYNFGCALASMLGDPEAALGMLGAVLERDTGRFVQFVSTDPDLASLRDDPRFQTMVAAAEARLAAAKPAGTGESP